MSSKHNSESQIVNRSVAVLCATLLLVYLILYFVKWDLWKQPLWVADCKPQLSWNISLSQLDEETWWQLTINNETYFMDDDSTWENNVNINSWDLHWNLFELDNDDHEYTWWMIVLSGTKTYYWTLDFVEKLWISYKYALVDWSWIYYVNMWDYRYDFSDIARKLWWNLYIMNTEQEILQNEMFGDKVTYINVPEYKNTKVLILLDINDQSWLLAIDYSIYHQVKTYLKSLFITTN